MQDFYIGIGGGHHSNPANMFQGLATLLFFLFSHEIQMLKLLLRARQQAELRCFEPNCIASVHRDHAKPVLKSAHLWCFWCGMRLTPSVSSPKPKPKQFRMQNHHKQCRNTFDARLGRHLQKACWPWSWFIPALVSRFYGCEG